jgi:hypothetical protein
MNHRRPQIPFRARAKLFRKHARPVSCSNMVLAHPAKRWRGTSWLGALVFALLSPSAALAQARDPVAAEALFRDAKRAMGERAFDIACPKFAESHRLDPAPGTLMNWADCEEQRGHLATAWEAWRASMDMLAADDRRQAFSKERADALEPRLPRIVLRLAPGSPEGTRVQRDKVELGAASLGTPLPVDPGAHLVVVRAPGRAEARYSVTVREGEVKEVALTAGAETAGGNGSSLSPTKTDAKGSTRSTASHPDASGSPTRRTLGLAMGGVGIAGLVAAGVTGAFVIDRAGVVERDCPESQCTTTEGYDAAQTTKTLLVINAISWGVGIVGLGAGMYLFLSSGSTPPPKAQSAALSPIVSPSGGGVSLRARF